MSTTIPKLAPGQWVRFQTPDTQRHWWWNVRCGDDRFTIITRQAEFKPRGIRRYSIIDRERGVRGPCNLIGQGWDAHMDDEACASLLRALQAHVINSAVREKDRIEHGTTEWPFTEPEVEVSYRNNVPVDIYEVRG